MTPHAQHTDIGAPLIEARDLVKQFPIGRGWWTRLVGSVMAVDGVSFTIAEGEILGLVGESGCGKSTLGRLVLNLLRPTSGSVSFEGRRISGLDRTAMRPLRRKMQIIFQDPRSSLNPRMTIASVLREALTAHATVPAGEVPHRIADLLRRVGLDPDLARRYPHEFSSGQRQRIGIARALAVDPSFLVCDEPVSALDVSIQAQILNLLLDLRDAFGLSFLFISHALDVVRHMSDRIGVMYLGKLVEIGSRDAICSAPMHPYTAALIAAAPVLRIGNARAPLPLAGDIPLVGDVPEGCAFRTRCPKAFDACSRVSPVLAGVADGHAVRCLLYDASWPDGAGRDTRAAAAAVTAEMETSNAC